RRGKRLAYRRRIHAELAQHGDDYAGILLQQDRKQMLGHRLWIAALFSQPLRGRERLLGLDRKTVRLHKSRFLGREKSKSKRLRLWQIDTQLASALKGPIAGSKGDPRSPPPAESARYEPVRRRRTTRCLRSSLRTSSPPPS